MRGKITKVLALALALVLGVSMVAAAQGQDTAEPQPAGPQYVCIDNTSGDLAYVQFRRDEPGSNWAKCWDGDGGLIQYRFENLTIGDVEAKVQEMLDAQPAPAPAQEVYSKTVSGPVTIEHIGGSINANQTSLGVQLEDLPRGWYLFQVDGAFTSSVAAADPSIEVTPQLSLFFDKDGDGRLDWAADATNEGSVSANAIMPVGANRHITVSGQILQHVDPDLGEDNVGLALHGYASDQSSARSGELELQYAQVTATPVTLANADG